MTTTAERLRSYWGERNIDADRLTALATRYWEVALYATLISFALGLRLWDLGARAIHHDEALHMFYAWELFMGRGYEHVPFMHGPLQFFGSAVIFRIFGDSDYTARLLYAVVGAGMVGAPFFLRSYLGRTGALTAALLLAISPTLLYFSRFARGDIFMVAFTLGLAIVIWRYLKEQKEAYLYAIAPLLVLSFLTIELTFMTTAIFLIYLEFQLARDLVDQVRAARPLKQEQILLAYVILLPSAWLIAALWPVLQSQRKTWSLTTLPPAGDLIVLIGTLSIVLFGPAIKKLPGGNDQFYQDIAGGQNGLFWGTTIVLLFGSAWVGLSWRPRLWALSAAAFYIPFVLLFTTGFTNMGGFKSGIWGSLDYWLGQQHVRRGNQPDYYYFMMTPVYEFLPLVFALGGSLYYAFRGKVEDRLLAGGALLLALLFAIIPGSLPIVGDLWKLSFLVVIGAVMLLPMEGFTKFLLFWTLSILFALSIAGEKMPWLLIHLAVPLALLAAKVLDHILSSVPATFAKLSTGEQRTLSPNGYWPLALGGALALAAAAIFQWAGPAAPFSIVAWLLSLAAAAVVYRTATSLSWQAAGQVAAVGLFAAMIPFTLRAAGDAAYDQGAQSAYPREMFIYAQGAPTLGTIHDEIERVAETSGLGRNLQVVIDNSINIWPWPWYMRDHPYQVNNFDEDFTPPAGAIVLISQAKQDKMQPYADDYYEPIPYRHMWWFPEFYRGLEPGEFLIDALRLQYLSTWRGYFIDRAVPGANDPPDHLAYFPKSFEPPTPPVTPTVPVEADTLAEGVVSVIAEPGGEPGQFSQPADMWIDDAGNLYVVDTQNHRIQRLSEDGATWETAGEEGGDDGEFGNPRSDTYQVDDGPWGITVDQAGRIYVADTWNGRIQVFDADLEFVRQWGQGELFGPRDVAIDGDGNVLIVDTGNHRIARYTPEGDLIESFGKPDDQEPGKFVSGDGPGEFFEPTSISIAGNGDIYVSDFWNKRIQVFDGQLRYRSEIAVESWGSQGVTDRAYILVLPDSHVLATDPGNGRILVFDAEGEEVATWRLPSAAGTTRPVGLAVDALGRVYISDGFNSRIVRVPLPELLTPPPAGGG